MRGVARFCVVGLALPVCAQAAAKLAPAAWQKEIRLEGGFGAPVLAISLTGTHVSAPGVRDATVHVDIRLPIGATEANFEAHAEGPSATKGGPLATATATGHFEVVRTGDTYTLARERPAALHLESHGFDLAALGELVPALPLAGPAALVLDASGTPSSPHVHTRLDAADRELRFRGEPLAPVHAEATSGAGRTTAEVRIGLETAPFLVMTADLPLSPQVDAALHPTLAWRDDLPHHVELRGRALDAARLRPFWRAPAAAAFTVDVDALLDGHLDRFMADVTVRGQLQDAAFKDAPLNVVASGRIEPQRQAFALRLGRDVLDSRVEIHAPLPEVVRGSKAPAEATVSGAVTAAVPLETVSPYLPSALYDAHGRLDGTLALSGTLGQPDVTGQLRLHDAAVTVRPVLLRLTALQAAIDVAGHTAKLTGLTAEAAPGKLGGEGQLEWRLTPAGVTPMDERAGGVPISIFRDFVLTGALRLDATDLPMVQPEIPRGFVTGHLDTAWEAGPGRQKLGFTVRDASVALSHVSLPAARGIPRNPSVNNRDWLARLENEESVLAGAGRLEMTIDVPQPVTIAGDDTELRVQGHMALRRQDTHVEVDGGLDVLAGRFVLFDNAFTLRHGRFTLMPGDLRSAADAIEDERTEGASPMSVGRQPGGMFEDETAEVTATLRDPEKPPEAEPLEPIVDLVANGYVVDTDVTVAVRGPARQPQLVLRSQPALAEYQILTLLITGRANALDDSGGDVRREASQLIDRFHNPSLERQVYDRLGVDKLGLAFGDSVDQPILTVGRQIDRELYVETVYHHNAPPTENAQELRIEYQLSPRFSIDTAYGDAAVGNVDLAWKGRFGGEPPAQPLSSLDVGELARPVVEPSVPPQAPVAPATPVAPQTKAPPP